MEELLKVVDKNGLIVGFFCIGVLALGSEILSKKFFQGKIPGSAIAIFLGLVLGYLGGLFTGGSKGIADIAIFQGIGTLGGSMFRDFAIVATAMGASYVLVKKSGLLGFASLLFGILIFFFSGVAVAYMWGISDPISLCTIGAGACTYIVGPVTGAALGADSDIIALSIAIGVVKTIAVTIFTPVFAQKIGLKSAGSAMAYGGIMGTSSGVAAGLAATDPKLVPYGAVTATFYTGLGCLICPSLFYLVVEFIFS